MPTATLGRTGLAVNKNGFGALPIQRTAQPEATRILQAARAAGIDFYDTARAYSDSEEKLGAAFGGAWEGLTLATKTHAKTGDALLRDLETSLRLLKKDCVDVYQFHNPEALPRPGDGSGLYEAMLVAKARGLIRFIGLTNHRLAVATEAVESGLYDTLQFPFSYLSSGADLELVALCRKKGVGFIAMKALAGGLITDVSAAAAWMAAQPDVVPIWGIQSMAEMEALAAAMAQPAGQPAAPSGSGLPLPGHPSLAAGASCLSASRPSQLSAQSALSAAHNTRIEADRAELQGEFCRACGYCMPCPQGIEINLCARIVKFMRRTPQNLLTEEWQAKVAKVEDCTECRQCVSKCPYGLEIPALLKKNLIEYREILERTPRM